ASDAAYCASAACCDGSAGAWPAFSSTTASSPAGSCANAAASPGSGVLAPAGQATPIRTSRSPRRCATAPCDGSSSAAPTANAGCPVAADAPSLRGAFRAAAASTLTIGSASNDVRLPSQSVAATCTANTPADFGCHVSVRQPPANDTRFVGPAAVVTVTVDGFDSHSRTWPTPALASLNAGGSFS